MEREYVTRKEFKELNDKVDNLKTEQTRTKERVSHMEDKLDKIEDNTTWILRLIIGAVIAAILAFILQSPETELPVSLGGFIYGK